MFTLHQLIDPQALAAEYRRAGRVTIAPLIADDEAQALFALLRDREDWRKVMNSGPDKVFELDRATLASLEPERRRAIDEAVYAGARDGFQFRYEAVRVPDEVAARNSSPDLLFAFARFLSSGPARDLLRTITGEQAIAFADAQATAFSPGDFLTTHHDLAEGKNRAAAYVFSLNPVWRIEWGGLLLMHHEDRHSADALVPGFNRLNLFHVPQYHSVSEVSRAAGASRYSITGWLRR